MYTNRMSRAYLNIMREIERGKNNKQSSIDTVPLVVFVAFAEEETLFYITEFKEVE